MPEVKDISRSSEKWVRQSQAASSEYEYGVKNPKKDWAKATGDAEDAYKAGVTAAANQGRFGKGVAKAGTQKWQQNALSKGVVRWPDGIRVSEAAWRQGFEKYANILRNLNLSARGPKGSPQNYKRVQEVGEALHKAKVSGS